MKPQTCSCPICQSVADRSKTPTYPFCSERCRMVDLGRWLDGDYRIPGDPADGEGALVDPDADPEA